MKVKITDGSVDVFPYSLKLLKQDNPDTDFPSPMTDDDFESWGVFNVIMGDCPLVAHDETTDPHSEPTLVDDVWTVGWTVRDLTEEEVIMKAAISREIRCTLLADSDWTQTNDSPLGDQAKILWATYRTALRDISGQSGFPTDIIWPNSPK